MVFLFVLVKLHQIHELGISLFNIEFSVLF